MSKSDDPLAFLLDLNQTVANKHDAGDSVVGPGLPPAVNDGSKLISRDCITMPKSSANPGGGAAVEGAVA